MDVRLHGDRSISLEIATKRLLVVTERLIKLIDQNLIVCIYIYFAVQTRDRNSDFICRLCLSFRSIYYFRNWLTNSNLISLNQTSMIVESCHYRYSRANCGKD